MLKEAANLHVVNSDMLATWLESTLSISQANILLLINHHRNQWPSQDTAFLTTKLKCIIDSFFYLHDHTSSWIKSWTTHPVRSFFIGIFFLLFLGWGLTKGKAGDVPGEHDSLFSQGSRKSSKAVRQPHWCLWTVVGSYSGLDLFCFPETSC